MQVMLPLPDGRERPDRVVQFAHSLDDGSGVEAANRVATWGLIAELSVFFWRPNYECRFPARRPPLSPRGWVRNAERGGRRSA